MTSPAGGVPLLVVAGEASGDLHAARLIAELRRLQPAVVPFGLGGDELREAGVELLAESREVAVVGITEVLRVLPRAREVFRLLLDAAAARQPAAAVLVDFPEFNLRLARQLKGLGIPVVYYVSPQVWAWRRGRVRTIARYVDRMLVLFPFEEEFYRAHGVGVEHVGHPLVDEVPELPQAWDAPSAGEGPRRLVMLPGSRRSEVEALLPAMLGAVRLLAREMPLQVTLVRARTVAPELVAHHVARSAVAVSIVDSDDRFAAIAQAHLALCASGTATLEVAMLRTPVIVVYRLQPWSYWLGRMLVRVPYFSLVNLVLGAPVVPELIQGDATPPVIAGRALTFLRDAASRNAMRARLATVRGRLGEGGASRRAASAVASLLAAQPMAGVA